MSLRRQPEQAIQRTVVQHLQARAVPRTYWFHVPNGGSRRPIEAAILKTLGVRAGVPDMMVICNGRIYGLELKAEGGRTTEAQRLAHEELRAAGAEVGVAVGLDAALDQLEQWGVLR
jgi:hypothetical protein